MLFFRSEAHVDRWCKQRNQQRGESFSLETCWGLAKGWVGDRFEIRRKKTVEEARALFDSLGLTSPFWDLS